MSGPEQTWPDNLSDVAATDEPLDDLAAGRPVKVGADDGTGAMAGLLATWRAELDDRAATVMTAPPLDLPPARPSRWLRAHQRTAAATAVVVAIAASGGVAAAASGPTGPLGGLNRLIFGHPAVHQVDTLAASAGRLLDKAGQQINAANRAGTIRAAQRNRIAGDLDKADRLLTGDPLAPQVLVKQLANLRTALAGIPPATQTPTPTVTDHHGHGSSGGSDNQGDDRNDGGGSQGEDNSSGGDDNQGPGSQDDGSQDGGSQGSDGGSGSDGGDQSGSGDQSSSDGGDGSGDSGSSDDGSSGGGSDSGSTDDGSSSGGSDSGSD
jgi:hypothetical protein